jgi:predicted nucleic acid-binding protein
MIVVSDTSSISNLLQIGEIDLLRRIFYKIVIPTEVFAEICKVEKHKEFLSKQDWIETATLSDTNLKDSLLNDLDGGEAEAIALAVELKAEYLLMDETKGRQIAENFNIKVTGILGILIKAKEEGLITELKPYLQRLVDEAGFWLNPKLIVKILEIVNEK